MAIDKMTFVDIRGDGDCLDEVLQGCLRCGIFQPEYASRLSEYSFGQAALLRNPYGGLLIKINEVASQLGIDLDGAGNRTPSLGGMAGQIIDDSHAYLEIIREQYPKFFDKRNKIKDGVISYTMALDMLEHIDEPLIDFDEIRRNKYLKISFGRMPTPNVQKLKLTAEKPYEMYTLDSDLVQTWCFYVTAEEFADDVDAMFDSFDFERLHIPDNVHGTATDARTFLRDGLGEGRKELQASSAELDGYINRERKNFLSLYAEIRFLRDAYDLRKYVISIKESFHLVGYVRKRQEREFVAALSGIKDKIELKMSPAGGDKRLEVPVELKNNRFVRPFEMFVNMYGSPSYNDIDPSPFVAYTYSLLFGMMFGDLGHGLCVFLAGFLIWKYKKAELGRIMSRIGVVSMAFGFLYGSVFGFEHALDWFYTGVLGLHEKPIEVMHPDTTNKILIAAIALGAAVILMVIIFNIVIGVKHKDFDRIVLSPNGIAGLVLYLAIMLALFEYFTDHEYLSPVAEGFLIVLPLVVVFFREPITGFIEYKSKADIIRRDTALTQTTTFQDGSININELFKSQFVSARFGRIPTDNYGKLTFYKNEPFVIYPVKTENDYIWCIYTAATVQKDEIDAIFRGLYFERIFIPDDFLKTNDLAEEYIKKCVVAGGIPSGETAVEAAKYGPVKTSKSKTAIQAMFPDGIGAFFTQTFFEMFEVVLSFITNTMSFLRVGGFILVHAGMMAVVFTLAEMVGGGASPVIILVGNAFVMCLEGLIVGIQVLRLEFYEIFSRFFDAGGEPFRPVGTNIGGKT